jgi:hypothetical protein
MLHIGEKLKIREEFLLPYVVGKPLDMPGVTKQILSHACATLSINT